MKFKIAGIILLFIGISIIGTAIFMRYDGMKKQQELTKAFEETIQRYLFWRTPAMLPLLL